MQKRKQGYTARDLVVDALCTALVLACTMFIRIPSTPMTGGILHLGNLPLILAAICFGRRTGAVCGAFGMAMFDLISGWTLYAPFTFVIAGLMGFVIGVLAEKAPRLPIYLLGVSLALLIKVAGYYFTNALLVGSWISPLASIPGDAAQVIVAAVIALPLAAPMRRLLRRITHQEG